MDSLSPLDGRYREDVTTLRAIFSEKAFMHYRLCVEAEYLIALSEQGITRAFSEGEKMSIRLTSQLSTPDFDRLKSIESSTHHDVKAVEYYFKEKLGNTSVCDSLEWIHFALTSEDVNNIAYGLMLRDGLGESIMPALQKVHDALEGISCWYKDVPMLARTHGQPASPTTVGKEFKVFFTRLKRQREQLGKLELLVKLNGATGNYNAHYAAYPAVDWVAFSHRFIDSFNIHGNDEKIQLKPNYITTQIEPHDIYAELCDSLRRINTILLDCNQDVWRYISDGWFVQKVVAGEVGSSTMPHKVNPIDFENSEGNIGIANALLMYFSAKLPISRLQRDLSDSTVERNFGVALGHCLLGYTSLLKGLSKIVIDEKKVIAELEEHPEVIAEAIQTILRRENIKMPYEQLKEVTRGKRVMLSELYTFIDGLQISDDIKKELKQITPTNYTGLARILTELY